jgi:hypothetical protein
VNFYVKVGTKIKNKIIRGTNAWKKNLEGLKMKCDIFRETKYIYITLKEIRLNIYHL